MSGRGISRGRAIRVDRESTSDNRGAVAGIPGEGDGVRGGGRSSSGSSGSSDSATANLRDLSLLGIEGSGNGNGVELPLDGGAGNGSGDRRRANGNGRSNVSPNGNGNGHGDTNVGLRGQPPRREQTLQDYDIVRTRPEGVGKQGNTGVPARLVANYFAVNRKKDWNIIHYHVEFSPDQEMTGTKKYLLRQFRSKIGPHIFDGASLFTSHRLCPPDSDIQYHGELRKQGAPETDAPTIVIIKIHQVAVLDPNTTTYIQFFNLIVRTCQQHIGLTMMGRHYFDPEGAVKITNQRLELWPGFITVMRQHERKLLLCVEITHKVIRMESVFDIMGQIRQEVRGRGGEMAAVKEEVKRRVIGSIVMTTYNKKTYRVDDIIWNEKATDTFPIPDKRSGVEVPTTFVDYYKNRYGINVRNPTQPLLMSKPKERDMRRGDQGPIKLLPELCQMTGLTQEMRNNFRLMRDLGEYLFQPPTAKLDSISRFMNRIRNSPEVRADLEFWGMDITADPVAVPGRILQREKILFGDGRLVEVDEKADFTNAFRGNKMVTAVGLDRWIVVIPQRDHQNLQNLIQTMKTVGRPIGFNMRDPIDIIQISNINPMTYSRAIQESIDKHKGKIDMVFVVLGTKTIEAYAAVKRKCYLEYSFPSQCFLAANMNKPKGLMSIATKVVIQMNAKLGGEPWNVQIPLKKVMFVGFDVHHGTPGTNSPSIGAMVCTTSTSYGRYFSTMSIHENRSDISSRVAGDFTKCLEAWRQVNHQLPERVFFYRDGVGEGQLHQINQVELEAIKKCIRQKCEEESVPDIKLTYIIVTKRINSRVFLAGRNGYQNPQPGTVVDDIITLPERWDFFLVSPIARQGTVSPTSYNILYERNGLDADKIQRLTYKLCHGYFNWSGTVAVPAPCQYAHKLAFLTGTATRDLNNTGLSHLLYFL